MTLLSEQSRNKKYQEVIFPSLFQMFRIESTILKKSCFRSNLMKTLLSRTVNLPSIIMIVRWKRSNTWNNSPSLVSNRFQQHSFTIFKENVFSSVKWGALISKQFEMKDTNHTSQIYVIIGAAKLCIKKSYGTEHNYYKILVYKCVSFGAPLVLGERSISCTITCFSNHQVSTS